MPEAWGRADFDWEGDWLKEEELELNLTALVGHVLCLEDTVIKSR